MIIKDLIDLKTINKRNLIRADVTKKIAIYTLFSVVFATAGLITGIMISPKVKNKIDKIKEEIVDLGSEVKDELEESYKEVTKN